MSRGARPGPAQPGRVVVVGAGLAGLSAAMHLRGAGCEVVVVDQGDGPGGLAAGVERSGSHGRYLLDCGPTVLTMPAIVAGCFQALGEDLSAWLTLTRLDPAYRAEFADGSGLSVSADPGETFERVADLAGLDEAAGYQRYLDHAERLYRLEFGRFIDRNLDSPLDLAGPPLARLVAARGFARLGPTVARYVEDDRLRRLLAFQSLYAGVAPERALAIYGVITCMDLVEGVYYPTGGMSALPEAMAAALAHHGVELAWTTTATDVERIGERVTAVRSADGRRFACDAVVLAVDAPVARQLVGQEEPGRPTRFSPSCVVLAAGLTRPVTAPGDWSAHHVIAFGRSWAGVFADLEQGRLMRDPSVLVSLPTVTDPCLAPTGGGTAYALFPAPNLDHEAALDWDRLRAPYREHMLRVLDRLGLPIGDALDVEVLTTPADWAARGLAAGTPFAAAHTFGQTGPFRTPNVLAPGVVLAGASTTPGVGVPMVLVSGRLAAQRLVGARVRDRSLA